jgi:predicted RNase H-like HicB family nuclease
VPDIPGCVAVGESREEVLALIAEAIEMHLEDLQEQGQLYRLRRRRAK